MRLSGLQVNEAVALVIRKVPPWMKEMTVWEGRCASIRCATRGTSYGPSSLAGAIDNAEFRKAARSSVFVCLALFQTRQSKLDRGGLTITIECIETLRAA